MASVLLVITPISWILLHQPQNDPADASIPMVTRTDDTYITPSTKAAVATPSTHVTVTPTATPTATPSATPTDTPSATPTDTPTDSPTDTPTDSSTETPTHAPTSAPTSASTSNPTTAPTSPGRTITTTKPTPTTPPPTTPPPPARDGGMTSDELQLFDMIDSARQNAGCAPLEQDPSLTTSARSDATSRSKSGSTNSTSSSKTTAGGDGVSAQQAYNQMMSQSRSTILNCSLKTLAVGYASTPHCKILLCLTGTADRHAWVADFE
ncbi:hypothetical protein [Kribbella karoonensis]|uniref:CAP domain-containing protein n=1 Tax=Kribbella karoonensis TaxID=324851 RepID=UPI0031D7506A